MKPVLPFLETMATQVCNLSCTGCTNYSDIKHTGYVTWKDMHQQLIAWLAVVDIPDFGIMGGEPLINPEISQWLTGTRELMPNSQIRFTTNGLLLDKYFSIVDQAYELGNIVFKITVHQNDLALEQIIERIFKRYRWQPVTEFGINRWTAGDRVRLQIGRPAQFLKTYQGKYSNMRPWDNNPVDSFDACIQQTCPLLYNGRIYKCSTQGLLQDLLEKFNNPNFELWEPYLNDGIAPHETNRIEKFIDNFGKPNTICQMCPTKKNQSATINHLENVYKK
jgi:hypothetical protein